MKATSASLSLLCAAFAADAAPAAAASVAPPACEAAFETPDPRSVALGRMLFYDPVLSGNREVSCATCHRADHGTSDGVSLSIGDGGRGVGSERAASADNPPEQRIPRNAQALFNLGAEEFGVMFHDGRLERDEARPGGLRTPLDEEMAAGFDSPLAAQAMFPILSPDEMAGHYGENDVSSAVRRGRLTHDDGAWRIIAARVEAIPAYRAAFDEVIGAERRVEFVEVANAIADFIAFEWRADDSPFDRFICDGVALAPDAAAGMALFYGAAGCADCHAGRFQTDHGFHAIAMPQLGPGKAERFERHARDVGRARVTGRAEDLFRFRTPSLRNVVATAPYGHAGAYATLEAAVRHHLDPVGALWDYDRSQALLPQMAGTDDFRIADDPAEIEAIAAANELPPRALSDRQVEELLAFLAALTDETSLKGRLGTPETVPSGLPVE